MVVNDEGWRRACGVGEGWMCVASVILLGAFACSAEPEPQPDPQPSELGRTAQALTNLGMARQIPVRVISLGRSQAEADRPATSTIRKALEYANHVYSPALLQVELAGVERYVVDSSFVKDEKTALSQADFEPFLEALGLPTDFCGSCCEQDCAINQRLLDVTGELLPVPTRLSCGVACGTAATPRLTPRRLPFFGSTRGSAPSTSLTSSATNSRADRYARGRDGQLHVLGPRVFG